MPFYLDCRRRACSSALPSFVFGYTNQPKLMKTGFSTYLVKMGNSFQTAFLPGLAAGFAGLMMVKKLRLWQGCFLCLTLPFFDAFFQCVVFPLLSSGGSGSVHLSAVAFNYVVSYTYSFSIFFIALVFYGIHAKDRLITCLCVSWNIFRYFLLYLIPPLFPQFNLEQLRMDEESLLTEAYPMDWHMRRSSYCSFLSFMI